MPCGLLLPGGVVRSKFLRRSEKFLTGDWSPAPPCDDGGRAPLHEGGLVALSWTGGLSDWWRSAPPARVTDPPSCRGALPPVMTAVRGRNGWRCPPIRHNGWAEVWLIRWGAAPTRPTPRHCSSTKLRGPPLKCPLEWPPPANTLGSRASNGSAGGCSPATPLAVWTCSLAWLGCSHGRLGVQRQRLQSL